MKNMSILISLILVFEASALLAQPSTDQEKEKIMEVFELFFDSVKKQDTVTLQKCVESVIPTQWFVRNISFIKRKSSDDQQLTGISTSTISGFLKSVSADKSVRAECRNIFGNINTKISQNYAVVTADYQCVVQDRLDKKGTYTIEVLKRQENWKIISLTCYTERTE